MADGAGFTFVPPVLHCETGAWDDASLPARDWLARGYLLRKAVTLVIGPGGVSKSTLMDAYAVGLALNLPVHGMQPTGCFKVMIFNVEDDLLEQRRRLSAILANKGRLPADIAGRIARVAPSGVGTLFQRIDGKLCPTAAMDELRRQVEEFQPDVLILDPLAELHTEDENANVALREVVAEFRKLAIEHNLALVLVHHTRKGPADPGNMDAARGASSVVSAARVVLTVSTMDEAAAERLGIAPDKRRHYFRVDGAKSNYAEVTEAEWFERVSFTVGQSGDTVAVPVPWTPPSEAVSLDTRLAIERAVEQGSGAGPWSTKLSTDPRSIRHLFELHGIRAKKNQQDELNTLFARGFVEAEFRKHNRMPALGIRAPDGQPHGVPWIEQTS